jgi:fatty-acyl-CoA synthase
MTAPTASRSAGPTDVPLLTETIGADLDRVVAAHGEREALVDHASGRRWSYRELAEEVDAVALGLLALGVAKGDRVGIWSPNCPEWTLVQYATAKIGAILVTVNPAYRTHELEFVLNQSEVLCEGRATTVHTPDWLRTNSSSWVR